MFNICEQLNRLPSYLGQLIIKLISRLIIYLLKLVIRLTKIRLGKLLT
jgi:hypothetical protein